jgi:hypothetical protein
MNAEQFIAQLDVQNSDWPLALRDDDGLWGEMRIMSAPNLDQLIMLVCQPDDGQPRALALVSSKYLSSVVGGTANVSREKQI